MRLKVAYIVSRFPHLPETFILREMIALEGKDIQVELFPLIIQKQKVVHPDAQKWLSRLHHIRLFSLGTLAANLRTILHQPGNYFSILFQIIWFNLSNPKFFIRAAFIFPVVVKMAEEMSAQAISHIHAHYATHPALAAFIISRLTRIPFSVSVHAHDIFVDHTKLKKKLQKAVFIRSISEFNRDYLSAYCGKWIEEKAYVIHCGILPAMYQQATKRSSNQFKVISIGSLQPYKGYEYLIRMCKKLKDQDYQFTCAIIGGGELRGDLFRKTEKLDLLDVVEFLGPKTESEVAEFLAQSHCYVQPSIVTRTGKMEGIPVAIMEALVCKLPVIAANISGIPELIEDHQTGLLVPPSDPQALADKIIWVINHPEESKKMADNGYKRVCTDFDLEKNTSQLMSLFIKHQKIK